MAEPLLIGCWFAASMGVPLSNRQGHVVRRMRVKSTSVIGTAVENYDAPPLTRTGSRMSLAVWYGRLAGPSGVLILMAMLLGSQLAAAPARAAVRRA